MYILPDDISSLVCTASGQYETIRFLLRDKDMLSGAAQTMEMTEIGGSCCTY